MAYPGRFKLPLRRRESQRPSFRYVGPLRRQESQRPSFRYVGPLRRQESIRLAAYINSKSVYVMSITSEHDLAISRWLILCLVLIFAMAVLDGLNRLTALDQPIAHRGSSLSLLPPLDDAQWRHEFSRYRQSPTYLKIGRKMELAEYKYLVQLNYAQRMLRVQGQSPGSGLRFMKTNSKITLYSPAAYAL